MQNIFDIDKMLHPPMIAVKSSLAPFVARRDSVRDFPTDIDHWPYTRYFRGDVRSSEAIVAAREAGFRPLRNRCYKSYTPREPEREWPCWQIPCSQQRTCRGPSKCLPNA